MEKECEICGGFYEATRSNQKYCPDCQHNSTRKRAAMEKRIAQNIRRYGACGEGVTYTLICQHCGEEFKTHNQYAKFCSIKCRKRNRIETAVCGYCGKNLFENGIEINAENYRTVFCSDKCREKYKWKTAEENGLIGTCQHCGKRFIMHGENAKFCSNNCYRAAVKNGWRPDTGHEPPKEPEFARCPVCKKLHKINDKYCIKTNIREYYCCSEECYGIILKKLTEMRRIKEKQKEARQEQRRILNEAKAKKNSKEQYIQENGLCSICKTPYPDCERMTSNFRLSPKGASFHNGKIVACPKYKGE